MFDKFFSWISPHSCCSCGQLGAIFCDVCKNDIISENFGRCLGCLKPFPDGTCGSCAFSLGLNNAWCVGERSGSLRALLDAYKFRSSKEAAYHIVDFLDATMPLVRGVVVPVPTAPQHIRARGFDHTLTIARLFAKKRGLMCRSFLEQTSNHIQHFKTKEDRVAAAQKSIKSTRSSPERVILIDDIFTTGATISACVEQLRGAGATDIDVIIVARQMME